MEKRYDFEEVTILSVIAVGVPGKRMFFLAMGETDDWVRIWLEKEQLVALDMAIDQFLVNISREFHLSPDESEALLPSEIVPQGKLPSGELEIEQIAIGFDQEKATLDFLVQVLGPQKIHGAQVNCRFTLSQIKHLGDQAKNVCAAGRPRCELCGYPIDPEGHTCPEGN
ncbi:DUF3090 family protein [Chloroflexota bacterium]